MGFQDSQRRQQKDQQQSSSGDPWKTFPGTGVAGVSSDWWNQKIVQESSPAKGKLPIKDGVIGPFAPDAPGVHPQMVGDTPKTVGQMIYEFDNGRYDSVIGDLQGGLWNGGFYGRSKKPTFTPGIRDDLTRSAFIRALKRAVHTQEDFGTTVMQAAIARSKAGMVGGGSADGGATSTNVIQHASPTDVGAGALAGFQAALGRGPTEKEKAAFLAAYRKQETVAQPETAGGGTFNITSAGSPETAAEQYARQGSPDLAQAHDQAGAFQMMLHSLGVEG